MSEAPYYISYELTGDYGALPSSRPWRLNDRVLAIPFHFDIDANSFNNIKIGVFIHIYYVDLCEEIRSNIINIPGEFDLYISTETEEKRAAIEEQFKALGRGRVTVRVFPARGRDIASFVVGFRDEVLSYDIVCRIHSKKSSYSEILQGWRKFLFAQLIGSEDIVNSILHLLVNGGIEFVFPDHYAPVVQSLNFGFNYENMKKLLSRAGKSFTRDILLEFPSGSMFWATSRALSPALALGLTFEDFPPNDSGEYQVDGTMAHAMERSFLYLAETSGAQWVKVCREQDCEQPERLLQVYRHEDIACVSARATRRLLGNRVAGNMNPRNIPEIPAVGFRAEKSLRPRFTLLTPTLRPEKVFGGVASSLRIFEEILSNLPADVDARIVSVTDSVDLDCLGTVPDYQQVLIGAANTEIARSVVDASGERSEQLPVRSNEVVLATAWWTAVFGFRLLEAQHEMFGSCAPLYYLIQDHEPDFYGWSARYALAQSTYQRPSETRAIINSEELFNFFSKNYALQGACFLPYRINQKLRAEFRVVNKEKIILIYGRPGTPRNCFEILIDGLCLWQQAEPVKAREWQIISAGETVDSWRSASVANFVAVGKLSLTDYAEVLCRASVGVSLMLSPHPSYPPLEMAEAGAITVTNSYECKDISQRSDNILSIGTLTPEALAEAIGRAIEKAEPGIGAPARFRTIGSPPCSGPAFSANEIASSMMGHLKSAIVETSAHAAKEEMEDVSVNAEHIPPEKKRRDVNKAISRIGESVSSWWRRL